MIIWRNPWCHQTDELRFFLSKKKNQIKGWPDSKGCPIEWKFFYGLNKIVTTIVAVAIATRTNWKGSSATKTDICWYMYLLFFFAKKNEQSLPKNHIMYHHKKLLIYQLVKNMLSKAFLEKKSNFFFELKGQKGQ